MLSKIFLGYITVKKKQKKTEPPLVSTLTLLSLLFFSQADPFPTLSLSTCHILSPAAPSVHLPLVSLSPLLLSFFLISIPSYCLSPSTSHCPCLHPSSFSSAFFLSILTILIKDVKNSY